jgi:hypothetical protein
MNAYNDRDTEKRYLMKQDFLMIAKALSYKKLERRSVIALETPFLGIQGAMAKFMVHGYLRTILQNCSSQS